MSFESRLETMTVQPNVTHCKPRHTRTYAWSAQSRPDERHATRLTGGSSGPGAKGVNRLANKMSPTRTSKDAVVYKERLWVSMESVGSFHSAIVRFLRGTQVWHHTAGEADSAPLTTEHASWRWILSWRGGQQPGNARETDPQRHVMNNTIPHFVKCEY